MQLRTFRAPRIRDALQLVKSELGPDAVIVATREVSRGLLGREIEVTAALEREGGEATEAPRPAAPRPAAGSRANGREVGAPGAPLPSPLPSALISEEARVLRAEIRALRELLTDRQDSARSEEDLSQLSGRRELTRPSRERIIALVGPTGVGKTTTLAKLAARSALMHSQEVAIVTTDTYRVGAEDQLRIFANLMGVPMFATNRVSELPELLHRLRGFDRVYVDTAGRSPSATEEMQETMEALLRIKPLEIHLTLSADARPESIDRWVRCYGREHLDRLLFTKVDEARDARELVRAPVRFELPVSFVSFGQRVPEDLVEANRDVLLRFATRGYGREERAA